MTKWLRIVFCHWLSSVSTLSITLYHWFFFSAGNKERFQRLWNPCRPTSSQPGVRLHDVRRHHQSIQSYWTRFKCLSFSKNEFRNHNTFPTRSRAIRRHGEVGFTFVKTSGWSSGGKWNRLLWTAAAAILKTLVICYITKFGVAKYFPERILWTNEFYRFSRENRLVSG